MKKLVSSILFLLTLLQVQAEGIIFSALNWKQLSEQASTSNKIIFVDFYATWCGPCKHLEKKVFTNAEVGSYFNEQFISMRIDAESEELELVKQMNIQAYPTLIFFNARGEVLYRAEGAPDADQLLGYAKKVSALPGLKENNAWKANSESLTVYLEALATHDPDQAEKIATNYLASLPKEDLRKDENWWILAHYVKDARDPLWQYVLNNAGYFAEAFDGFLGYVESLGEEMLTKAVDLKNPELLVVKSNLDILMRNVQGDSSRTHEEFQLWNFVSYSERIGNEKEYTTKLQEYIKKYCWEEPTTLTYFSAKIFNGNHAPTVYANATRWAERALVLNKDNYMAYWVLAIGYSKSNNVPKSNQALQNFLKFSKADPEFSDKISILLTSF